jgi:hypothetical protein
MPCCFQGVAQEAVAEKSQKALLFDQLQMKIGRRLTGK